jgi:hypothetical protein
MEGDDKCFQQIVQMVTITLTAMILFQARNKSAGININSVQHTIIYPGQIVKICTGV